MKPGMQRELLIHLKLLFEEFVLDDEASESLGTASGEEPLASPRQAVPPDKEE